MPKQNTENRRKLRVLMELYDVTVNDVAEMLGKSTFIVNSWRSISHVDIPTKHLNTLENKLIATKGYKEI